MEAWIRLHVALTGAIELTHERPWATVLRVPVAGGAAWFKASGDAQGFEPTLSAELFAHWPDRVAEVLGHDEERGWLLRADAGEPTAGRGNPPEPLLSLLPRYAELQRGEALHADEHLARGVPDFRVARVPERYDDLLRGDLPLQHDEIARLRAFAPRLAELCGELAAHGVAETVQHDDLHLANVYERGGRFRLLDWGDTSIAHPFASLVVPFRFLEEINRLPPTDRWFERLRDAYLEPWGSGFGETFALAVRVGAFTYPIAWSRQRDYLPEDARAEFDKHFSIVLRRAIACAVE